ncbi:TVP38/TMEM64 family protein [Bacillus sp. SCS-153A]|uniref:TVP38/TMEM64 family protein n=1 Tax=Rossellomorea sedimentorum TaxID=3115294 RepID=UPI003906547D
MEFTLTEWLGSSTEPAAIIISVLLNIIISILGFIPSAFLTAANLKIFGFEYGLIISFAGEALGAIISFILYRKGIKKFISSERMQHKYLLRLGHSTGTEAFFLVFALRLFPLMPSGLVTLSGAFSKMGIFNFAIASSLGKVPSILIEAYSIQEVLIMSGKGKMILLLISFVMLVSLVLKIKKSGNKN